MEDGRLLTSISARKRAAGSPLCIFFLISLSPKAMLLSAHGQHRAPSSPAARAHAPSSPWPPWRRRQLCLPQGLGAA